MKFSRSRLLSSVWLTAFVVMSGSTWLHAQELVQTDRPLRLAFITCCKDAPFFEPVKKGMQDAAEKMGVSCTWMGIEGVDMQAQADLVAQAVEDKYDGIALNLVDPVAFDKVAEEAIKQGIPVVGFNTDDHATPNPRLSCVNQRLYEAGKTLAEHVAPDIPEGAHVLMTMHDEGVSSLEDRLRGLQDVLKEKNVRWTVCITGTDAAKGSGIIEQELRKQPEIRVVLSTGQADTEAAGRAIEKSFAGKGYWAAGFDLSPTTLRLIKAEPYPLHGRPAALHSRVLSGHPADPVSALRHHARQHGRRRHAHHPRHGRSSAAVDREEVPLVGCVGLAAECSCIPPKSGTIQLVTDPKEVAMKPTGSTRLADSAGTQSPPVLTV